LFLKKRFELKIGQFRFFAALKYCKIQAGEKVAKNPIYLPRKQGRFFTEEK